MTSLRSALRATIDLPPVARSVPAARRVLVQLLTAWSVPVFSDDAALLVTELVTNVVRHVAGQATLTVEVSLAEPVLHVAVIDSSSTLPALRDRTADGGHGLWLLGEVADRWGSEEHGDGKRTWFELRPAAS
jgi:anti-sigma regulatory factor (Ser/Thr protein kinase)